MQTHNPYHDNMENKEPMLSQDRDHTEWLNLDFDEFSEQQILEHMQSNPLGRLLQMIASLPEVRREKVLRARREIREDETVLESRLDIALDRVLEELILED